MNQPLAYVHPGAKIAKNVVIEPFTTIHNNVKIGEGTWIGSNVTIMEGARIGKNCSIFPGAVISAVPQDLKYNDEDTTVEIGDNVTIRECVTINRGTEFGGGLTQVGEENYLMAYTHIAHDCKTGKQVILANNSTLGGHIIIGDNVTVGGLVAIHQFVNIGDYAYIGGKSAVVKDIPPYVIAAGDRASLHGLNNVGLKRHKFPKSTLRELKKAYRIFFRIGLTVKQASERVKAETEQIPEVQNFINSIVKSNRGVTR